MADDKGREDEYEPVLVVLERLRRLGLRRPKYNLLSPWQRTMVTVDAWADIDLRLIPPVPSRREDDEGETG
jgi:hypothetical protein